MIRVKARIELGLVADTGLDLGPGGMAEVPWLRQEQRLRGNEY